MKDGRTHLARKAEHAVDMATGAIVAVAIQGADRGDTTTLLMDLDTPRGLEGRALALFAYLIRLCRLWWTAEALPATPHPSNPVPSLVSPAALRRLQRTAFTTGC